MLPAASVALAEKGLLVFFVMGTVTAKPPAAPASTVATGSPEQLSLAKISTAAPASAVPWRLGGSGEAEGEGGTVPLRIGGAGAVLSWT